MNKHYRETIPQLQENLSFELEEITSLDLFYNDGDSRVRSSYFKLVVKGENKSSTVVYIQEKTYWVSFGSLTKSQETILNEWIVG